MILYRPVGQKEFDLIKESEFKKFPPRLEWQPIFYPVLNVEYATQIARDWNTTDEASGFVGYVLQFEIEDKFIARYTVQTAGSSQHQEYWIPAEDLNKFNKNLKDRIKVLRKFNQHVENGFSKIEAIMSPSLYDIYEGDYPYIFIDGLRLDDLISKADSNFLGLYPSWIDWYEEDYEPSKKEKKYVWEKSRLDNGIQILPILLCPDDWDFWCTVILVEVIPQGDKVIWNRFGLDISGERIVTPTMESVQFERDERCNPKFFEKIRWFSDLGPFTFDRKEYEACQKTFDDWNKAYKSKK